MCTIIFYFRNFYFHIIFHINRFFFQHMNGIYFIASTYFQMWFLRSNRNTLHSPIERKWYSNMHATIHWVIYAYSVLHIIRIYIDLLIDTFVNFIRKPSHSSPWPFIDSLTKGAFGLTYTTLWWPIVIQYPLSRVHAQDYDKLS